MFEKIKRNILGFFKTHVVDEYKEIVIDHEEVVVRETPKEDRPIISELLKKRIKYQIIANRTKSARIREKNIKFLIKTWEGLICKRC